MNEEAIFLIGAIVFAITVYGTVMAAGVALTRVVTDHEPSPQPAVEDRPPASTIPVDEGHR